MKHLTVTFLALTFTACRHSAQQDFDRGYWQGASDSIKRHYWARQQAQGEEGERAQTVYYTCEEPPPAPGEPVRTTQPKTIAVKE